MTYAANSSLTGFNDGPGARSYSYDDYNRLKAATEIPDPTPSPDYEYDRYGNRWRQGTQTLSYDNTNKIATGNGVTYDALGNIVSETVGGGTYTYTYDAENRLIQSNAAGTVTDYTYDSFGRRVRKQTGAAWTEYYYDTGGKVVAVWNAAGFHRGEVWLGAMHLGTYATIGGQNQMIFSHGNWLGTERTRTDVNGNTVQDCEYNPFGELRQCAINTSQFAYGVHHYAGYERDGETGLDHMWFRYYNPRLGRFMTSDPLSGSIGDPQSLNKFGYTFGDPANLNDPLGLDPPPPTWCGSGPRAGQCYIDYYRAYADRFIGASSALAGMVQVWLYTGEFSVDGANARGSDLGGFGGVGIPIATGTTDGVLINANPSLFDFLPEMPQQCDFGQCLPDFGMGFAPKENRFRGPLNLLTGSNYCGFGGKGDTLHGIDAACKRHDACYAQTSSSAWDNLVPPFLLSKRKKAAIDACDVKFCSEASAAIPETQMESGAQLLVRVAFCK